MWKHAPGNFLVTATQTRYWLWKHFDFACHHAERHSVRQQQLLNYSGTCFSTPVFRNSEVCVCFSQLDRAACVFLLCMCVCEIQQCLVSTESDGWIRCSSMCPIWPWWGLLVASEETSNCLLIMSIHLPLYFGRHFLSVFITFVGNPLLLFPSLHLNAWETWTFVIRHVHFCLLTTNGAQLEIQPDLAWPWQGLVKTTISLAHQDKSITLWIKAYFCKNNKTKENIRKKMNHVNVSAGRTIANSGQERSLFILKEKKREKLNCQIYFRNKKQQSICLFTEDS